MLEQSPGNFGNARVPYDWYQNLTHVIITIRIANLKENDVKVTIINDALDVMCQLIDGRQFRMHFNLYKTVMVQESNWAVDTSKLVINLRKNDRKRWHSLETIPDKSGTKPKSFIGIVNIREAKNELTNLLSATEFENNKDGGGSGGGGSAKGGGNEGGGGSNNAITITQARTPNSVEGSNDPISLDYNWYQTDNYINLVIHVPNIKVTDGRSFLFYEDDINIILTDNTLNWICNFPTGVTNVNFKLYREINSGDSRYEISPCRTKIEIKLRKLDESYWPSFVIDTEAENGDAPAVGATTEGTTNNDTASQPSSTVVNNNNTVQSTEEGVEVLEVVEGKPEVLVYDGTTLDEEQVIVATTTPSTTSNSTKIKPTASAPSTRLQAAAH